MKSAGDVRQQAGERNAGFGDAGQQADHYAADRAGQGSADGGEDLTRVGDHGCAGDGDGDAGEHQRERSAAESGGTPTCRADRRGFFELSTLLSVMIITPLAEKIDKDFRSFTFMAFPISTTSFDGLIVLPLLLKRGRKFRF